MENKAQVIVQNIDEDSVKRGFQTENALVLHVNDKGEGLLTVWGYAHGKKIDNNKEDRRFWRANGCALFAPARIYC